MNNNINAFWYRDNNFGDELVPYIINKLSDKHVVWVDSNSNTPKYIVIGSILDWGIKNATVWGCGVMHNNTQVSGTTFHAVRGNFTKKRLIEQGHKCDNIALGDPALIMPYLYNPKVDKKYKIGIFAHFIDIDDVKKRNNSNYFIINPRDDRETVIKQVLACDVIVSSSLHGLIIADAYGIKNKWVKFGNRLSGDDSKFHDYYQSINYPDETFIDMRTDNTINLNNIEYISKKIPDDIIPNLIHTCPFITNKMRDIILTKHGSNNVSISKISTHTNTNTYRISSIFYKSTSGSAKSKAESIQVNHPLIKIRGTDMGDEFQLVDVNNTVHQGLKANSIIHSLLQ